MQDPSTIKLLGQTPADLEDSLTYSPLKDVTNKENSPVLFVNGLERVRKSPSAARLLALFGSASTRKDPNLASPVDSKITPKRLQDFWDTPSKPGLEDPPSKENTSILSDLASEVAALRSSLEIIQKDCEFHRQRAVAAQDQVDHLNTYIGRLEEENRRNQHKLSEVSIAAPRVEDDEKQKLSEALSAMETLNRSLARQNDILRSRSSVTSRFEKRDARSQTETLDTVDVGVDPIDIVTQPPVHLYQSHRSEIHLDHALNSPAVKVSRVLYIKDAESQTEPLMWESKVVTKSTDISPSSQCVRLPIPDRRLVPDILAVPIPERGDSRIRVRGYPYRTAQRARRSLPSYLTHPDSPSCVPSRRKVSVPKPLFVSSVDKRSIQGFIPVDDSPQDWQTEWRILSSARRGKSTGSMSRPRWIP
jgi:hypothetical protein